MGTALEIQRDLNTAASRHMMGAGTGASACTGCGAGAYSTSAGEYVNCRLRLLSCCTMWATSVVLRFYVENLRSDSKPVSRCDISVAVFNVYVDFMYAWRTRLRLLSCGVFRGLRRVSTIVFRLYVCLPPSDSKPMCPHPTDPCLYPLVISL
jgi:hypothetical protein